MKTVAIIINLIGRTVLSRLIKTSPQFMATDCRLRQTMTVIVAFRTTFSNYLEHFPPFTSLLVRLLIAM